MSDKHPFNHTWAWTASLNWLIEQYRTRWSQTVDWRCVRCVALKSVVVSTRTRHHPTSSTQWLTWTMIWRSSLSTSTSRVATTTSSRIARSGTWGGYTSVEIFQCDIFTFNGMSTSVLIGRVKDYLSYAFMRPFLYFRWHRTEDSITSFSLGYNSRNNKLKTPLLKHTAVRKHTTMSPEVVKTYCRILNNLHAISMWYLHTEWYVNFWFVEVPNSSNNWRRRYSVQLFAVTVYAKLMLFFGNRRR